MIDAPCGAGKTTWAIDEMAKNDEQSFVYCTPFLSEIDRVKREAASAAFVEPENYIYREEIEDYAIISKLESFNTLLSEGKNIAVSHSTFLNATPETLELVREGSYTLIIDEALDVVTDFNSLPSVVESSRQSMSKDDISFLLEHNLIIIGDNGRVIWNGGNRYEDSKFMEVARLADLGRIYLSRDTLLVTVFPPEVFHTFNNIFVLTYMFDGSILKCYFDLFNIRYRLASIVQQEGEYQLTDYSDEADKAFRRSCKRHVNVFDKGNLNRPRRKLTKDWYKRYGNAAELKQLKNDIGNYFNRYVDGALASNGDIMWTCPKEYKNKLAGKGYTCSRKLTKDEKQLTGKERKRIEAELDCFVSCNARATNDYRNRWALAYCCNPYRNPYIDGFFVDCGITPDLDAYALSSLIQWICRSRLRDGKDIYIYIPSQRVRELFLDWMNI